MLPRGLHSLWTSNTTDCKVNAMLETRQLTLAEMEASLETIRQAPKDIGVLKLISRRPNTDEREVLNEAQLDPARGLVGDNWKARGSRSTPDGSANHEMQLNVMNARVIELADVKHWPHFEDAATFNAVSLAFLRE